MFRALQSISGFPTEANAKKKSALMSRKSAESCAAAAMNDLETSSHLSYGFLTSLTHDTLLRLGKGGVKNQTSVVKM